VNDRDQPAVGRTADGAVVFCNPDDPDIELVAGLRDMFDRVDPVPASVTAACQLGDLRQDVRIPQLGAFVRELLRNEASADDAAKEDQP